MPSLGKIAAIAGGSALGIGAVGYAAGRIGGQLRSSGIVEREHVLGDINLTTSLALKSGSPELAALSYAGVSLNPLKAMPTVAKVAAPIAVNRALSSIAKGKWTRLAHMTKIPFGLRSLFGGSGVAFGGLLGGLTANMMGFGPLGTLAGTLAGATGLRRPKIKDAAGKAIKSKYGGLQRIFQSERIANALPEPIVKGKKWETALWGRQPGTGYFTPDELFEIFGISPGVRKEVGNLFKRIPTLDIDLNKTLSGITRPTTINILDDISQRPPIKGLVFGKGRFKPVSFPRKSITTSQLTQNQINRMRFGLKVQNIPAEGIKEILDEDLARKYFDINTFKRGEQVGFLKKDAFLNITSQELASSSRSRLETGIGRYLDQATRRKGIFGERRISGFIGTRRKKQLLKAFESNLDNIIKESLSDIPAAIIPKMGVKLTDDIQEMLTTQLRKGVSLQTKTIKNILTTKSKYGMSLSEKIVASQANMWNAQKLASIGAKATTLYTVGSLAFQGIKTLHDFSLRTINTLNKTLATAFKHEFGTGQAVQTRQAMTERQLALQAIQNAHISARNGMGNEAQFMHSPMRVIA